MHDMQFTHCVYRVSLINGIMIMACEVMQDAGQCCSTSEAGEADSQRLGQPSIDLSYGGRMVRSQLC